MTGAPAETWRKVRFRSPPLRVALSLVVEVLGLGGFGEPSGYLPLTRASSRHLSLFNWARRGLIAGLALLWILGYFLGVSIASTVHLTSNAGWYGLFLVGSLSALIGTLGWLVVRSLKCPGGKVLRAKRGRNDHEVELRNVHPAFVAAVTQIHQARAQQYPAMQAQANVSLPPGSN